MENLDIRYNKLLNNIKIENLSDVEFVNSTYMLFSENHSVEENYFKLMFLIKNNLNKNDDNFEEVMHLVKYKISSEISNVWNNCVDVRFESLTKIVDTKIITEIYEYRFLKVEPNYYYFEDDFYLTIEEIMDFGFWKLRRKLKKIIDKY